MKKQTKNARRQSQSRAKRNSNLLIAATALTVPMLSIPSIGLAQAGTSGIAVERSSITVKNTSEAHYIKFTDIFIKDKGSHFIAGMDGTHTIYRTSDGKYFYVEPGTGDMKFVSSDYFMKFKNVSSSSTMLKNTMLKQTRFDDTWLKYHKESGAVRLVGVDAKGNVVQQNAQGEKFFLDSTTGDMVFIK
jgi:hypothetical protein